MFGIEGRASSAHDTPIPRTYPPLFFPDRVLDSDVVEMVLQSFHEVIWRS